MSMHSMGGGYLIAYEYLYCILEDRLGRSVIL